MNIPQKGADSSIWFPGLTHELRHANVGRARRVLASNSVLLFLLLLHVLLAACAYRTMYVYNTPPVYYVVYSHLRT